jgi:hypothetical protein
VPSPSALDHMNMTSPQRLSEQPGGKCTALASGKTVILPAQEVARMHGDQVKKRRLALDVADCLKS